jgi:deazaflavin-dependent oxidoreductase (nitroreductase family)
MNATASPDANSGATPAPAGPRYLEPGWFTRHVFNRLMRLFTKLGVSLRGSRELRVRGRKSGEWRAVPVNPLTIGDDRFLVAPRGATEWVRNLRVAGTGELHLGRKVEVFVADELDDDAKPEILRQYLHHWKADAQLREIAPGYPVFLIQPAA